MLDRTLPLIRCRDLTRAYRRGSETLTVLDGLQLDVHEGEFVGLMGPSGSGKSTLLNLLSGLDQPTAGEISIEGVELSQHSPTGGRRTSASFFSSTT